jgi:long-chain acyl-CoA synthetase
MTTTFPQLLLKHATERPTPGPAREGVRHLADLELARSRADRAPLACGLRALGLTRAEPFIRTTAPCVHGLSGRAGLGGVPIPLYQDAVAAEMPS